MNEIKIENGENLYNDIENIKEELQECIKNMELLNEEYKKEKENSFQDLYYENPQSKDNIKLKKRKIKIHVTLFVPVLQFLDINSLMELSRVNHMFHSFIFSLYFYRSVNQVLNYSTKKISKIKILKKKKEKISPINNNLNTQSQEEQNIIIDQTKKIYSSFMSAITGALNYINPTPGITPVAKGEKNELAEIEKKIALHEKLIDGRINQIQICKEIDNIKEEMDRYIDKQYKNKKLIESENINDKNERENLEMEYNNLINEIKEIETEYEKIKKDNENRNKIDVELENKINKIKHYSNNIFQNKDNF